MAAIDLEKIKDLLEELAFSPTKKSGEAAWRKLEFIASGLRGELSGYTVGKFEQAINHAKAASGRVRDKEHQIQRMNNAWYVFKTDVAHLDLNT